MLLQLSKTFVAHTLFAFVSECPCLVSVLFAEVTEVLEKDLGGRHQFVHIKLSLHPELDDREFKHVVLKHSAEHPLVIKHKILRAIESGVKSGLSNGEVSASLSNPFDTLYLPSLLLQVIKCQHNLQHSKKLSRLFFSQYLISSTM